MTKNESFKKRIRARMAKTGERYTAVCQSLLDQTAASRRRAWVSDPEITDDSIAKTLVVVATTGVTQSTPGRGEPR